MGTITKQELGGAHRGLLPSSPLLPVINRMDPKAPDLARGRPSIRRITPFCLAQRARGYWWDRSVLVGNVDLTRASYWAALQQETSASRPAKPASQQASTGSSSLRARAGGRAAGARASGASTNSRCCKVKWSLLPRRESRGWGPRPNPLLPIISHPRGGIGIPRRGPTTSSAAVVSRLTGVPL